MSESQSHGFLVQYQILENIYGYIELDSSRYTSKHDLCSDYNDVDSTYTCMTIRNGNFRNISPLFFSHQKK
jgi:hypothetical protein